MFTCPVNNDSWKALVKAVGEDHAYTAFFRNGNETPSVDKAKELLEANADRILRSNESLQPFTAQDVVTAMVKNGAIVSEPLSSVHLSQTGIEHTPVYEITDLSDIGERLAKVTDQYGAVVEYVKDNRYDEPVMRVRDEMVKLWNEAAAIDHTKALKTGDLLTRFLHRAGIEARSHAEVIDRFQSHGLADIQQKIILLQDGYEELTLSEEAMHFFVEMLPANDPALVQLMDEIRKYDVYREVLEQYSGNQNYQLADGTPNYTKLKKEAIGKALAQVIVSKSETSDRLVDKIKAFFKKLLDFIKGVKVKPTALDKLADSFMSERWENLNYNLNSSEIYNQLKDEEKAFYEAQGLNDTQKDTLAKVFSVNANFTFDEDAHQHYYVNPASGETIAVPSATTKLGSDFDGDLDSPETVRLIYDTFKEQLPHLANGKEMAENLIEAVISERISLEDIRDIEPKLHEIFERLVNNKQKTLFGTAIHNFMQDIILDRAVNLDEIYDEKNDAKLDPKKASEHRLLRKLVPKAMFQKVLYGDAKTEGLIDYIRSMRKRGSLVITEIQLGNEKVAGISDILEIDKDGVVHIHDFKTKFLKNHETGSKTVLEGLFEEFNKVITLQSSSPVKNKKHVLIEAAGRRRTLTEKWSQQLTLYKKMLMNAGIAVGDLTIIGIPYRMNEEGKVQDAGVQVVKESIKYLPEFGKSDFPFLDEKYDTNSATAEVLREDARVKDLERMSREKMKESFAKAFGPIQSMFTFYKKNKDAKDVYKLFTENTENQLGALRGLTQSTLDNYEKISDFLSIQHNFLHLLDDMENMLTIVAKAMEEARTSLAVNDVGFGEKFNMINQLHVFAKGFDTVLNEFAQDIDSGHPDNLVVKQIAGLRGMIQQIDTVYKSAVTPVVTTILKDAFSPEGFANMKRHYDEMIAAASGRGDTKLAEKLTAERDHLTNDKLLLDTIKGEEGDVHWFWARLTATISIPDLVLAGVAKKLKTTLDNVRLMNKQLKDDFTPEFESRKKAYGTVANVKTFNEPLLYIAKKINTTTGEERDELWIKTLYDESLHYEHDKRIYALNKARKEGDKDAIRQAQKELTAFEREFMMPDRTEAFYKATELLDQTVSYKGEDKTVREIQEGFFNEINEILGKYNEQDITEGKVMAEDMTAIENLQRELKQLRNRYDEHNKLKTGDALRIYEILNEHAETTRGMYEYIELTGLFERKKQQIIDTYGINSKEYQDWYAKNTRKVVTEEYWNEFFRILDEITLESKRPESQRLVDLHKQRREITNPYRDEDGVIQGDKMPLETQAKIKEIDAEIKDVKRQLDNEVLLMAGLTPEEIDILNEQQRLKERADPRYSPMTVKRILSKRAENKRLKELYAQLAEISRTEYTEYYNETLNQKKQEYAEANAIDVSDIDNAEEHRKGFEATDWFQKNHTSTTRATYNEETDATEYTNDYEPIYIWKRSVPLEIPGKEFVKTVPAAQYYRRKLKESYINKEGNEVRLINKDNRDILGRLKAKSNEDYKRQYSKDHPYLSKDYVNLQQRYNNRVASEKEKVDYENLIFLEGRMMEQQADLPMSDRLGMAVPFAEKGAYDRFVEDGKGYVGGKVDNLTRGLKRAFTRNEDDMNEGLGTSHDFSKLATVDNNEVRYIPVKFTSKGEIADASYDVFGSVLKYLGSVNRKKALEQELGLVTALETLMADPSNQPKSESKNLIVNEIFKKYLPDVEKKINMKGKNLRLETLRSFVSSVMYNEETFEGFDIAGINSQKVVNNMMALTSWNTFAFGVFNWSVNWLSGNVQLMIESAGGEIFTVKDVNSAKKDLHGMGKYGTPIKDLMADVGKVGQLSFWGQMMEVFDPIQGEFEDEYGTKTTWSKRRNVFGSMAMSGRIIGEWEIQMSSFIAFMKNHKLYNGEFVDKQTFITKKIGDITGKSIQEIATLKREALEEFHKLDTNLLDVFELKDKKLVVKDQYKDNFEIGSKQFSDVVAKLHALHKKLNGSYNKFDRSWAEKTSIGRMMFFFRKHILPLGMNRFGKRRANMESMNIEEGFYLTFLRTFATDLKKMRFNIIKNWSTYSDHEKRAIRKTLTEIGMILAMISVYMVLFGFNPDDEDRYDKLREKGYLAEASVFMALKVKSETEQFIPLPGLGVSELMRTINSPSLIFNQLAGYSRLTGMMIQHAGAGLGIVDGDKLFYDKDSDEGDGALYFKDKGESKLVAEAVRSLGYSGKTFQPIDLIKGFEMTQNRAR